MKEGKIKIFLTHGGYGSFIESIETNIPMLTLPIYPTD
jgi:UDP:flavonoid glycosyltransferase YjiC (YdhE family)